MTRLSDALFNTTQQRVLGLLYGQPQRSFYTNEILRLTGMGVATVKRELDSMLAAGILTLERRGNQHHYQANPDCPIYHELLAIVRKTFGVAGVLKSSLASLEEGILQAFVFGSIASGKESSGSDIDVLIVGDVGYAQVVKALYPAQEILGREINPKLYSSKEWAEKLEANDCFILEILKQPRLQILGDKDDSRKPDWYQSGTDHP